MTKIQELLASIFRDLNSLKAELQPYDKILKACEGKPLDQCGASDRIKIAIAVLEVQGLEVPERNP